MPSCALPAQELCFQRPSRQKKDWDKVLRGTLVDLLNGLRNQETGVSKDKVYALHGLLQQLEIDLPTPDYADTYSLEDTYLEFTHTIIEWHGSLDILREVSGPWSAYAPSWVPDWSRKYERVRIPAAEVNARSSRLELGRSYVFSEDHLELTTFCWPVGKIVFSAEAVRSPIEDIDAEGNGCLSTQALHDLCESITVLRKWLKGVTDRFHFSIEKTYIFLDSISTWHETCTDDERHTWVNIILSDPWAESERLTKIPASTARAMCILRQFYPQDLYTDSLGWRILLLLATNERLWGLHRRLCTMLAKTVTFIVVETVEDGCLLGMGSTSIQNGDSLVMLPTLQVPMVVRAVENSAKAFQLMGAVHLPGLEVRRDDMQLDYMRIV